MDYVLVIVEVKKNMDREGNYMHSAEIKDAGLFSQHYQLGHAIDNVISLISEHHETTPFRYSVLSCSTIKHTDHESKAYTVQIFGYTIEQFRQLIVMRNKNVLNYSRKYCYQLWQD